MNGHMSVGFGNLKFLGNFCDRSRRQTNQVAKGEIEQKFQSCFKNLTEVTTDWNALNMHIVMVLLFCTLMVAEAYLFWNIF
jgi:hypothetical protein